MPKALIFSSYFLSIEREMKNRSREYYVGTSMKAPGLLK